VQPVAAGLVEVLAHDSDPLAVIGVFAPALVVVAVVVGLVVRDRRRSDRDAAGRAEDPDELSPPTAG
jgi:hypothetical protein